MFPALLATLLFALSTVSGRRNVRWLGSARANFWRQLVAVAFLALYAHSWGHGFQGVALGWFLLSGFIGFGLGDVGVYLALPRIGARLTALIAQCLAAPAGVAMAWAWHGTRPTGIQVLAGGLILAGVAVALAPQRSEIPGAARSSWSWSGVFCGVLAALGQAGGQVVSKQGFQTAAAAGVPADPITVTYQRILPGLAVALGWLLVDRWLAGRPVDETRAQIRTASPWILLNALAGPTLGVACYQWATKVAETSLVLSVTAMTPLCVVPLAYLMDGEIPTRRSIWGGLIAVGGVVLLAQVRP